MIRSAQLALLVCGTTLAAGQSHAHGGLSAGTLQVSVTGAVVHINATPAPALFEQFDTDGDGELAEHEVHAQRAAMLEFFVGGLAVVNPDGEQGEYVLEDLALPVHTHEGEEPYIRVTLRLQWPESPETLHVEYSHGAVAPLRVTAMRAVGDAALRTTGELNAEHPVIMLFQR